MKGTSEKSIESVAAAANSKQFSHVNPEGVGALNGLMAEQNNHEHSWVDGGKANGGNSKETKPAYGSAPNQGLMDKENNDELSYK